MSTIPRGAGRSPLRIWKHLEDTRQKVGVFHALLVAVLGIGYFVRTAGWSKMHLGGQFKHLEQNDADSSAD